MSKRTEIDRHLHALGEITEIMRALKNLSFMEIRKLSQFLEAQRRVVNSLESATDDFLSFYFTETEESVPFHNVYILIGSERGFCGDFNEALWKTLEEHRREAAKESSLVVVGYKLASRLLKEENVAAVLDGPNVVEEIESVLARLLETLTRLQDQNVPPRPMRLTVLHHRPDEDGDRIGISVFDPFRQTPHRTGPFPFPPELNLLPRRFMTQLADLYLFAGLHAIFYDSLMAENHRRLQHLESAIRHMEQETDRLKLKGNMLRQEEITEEIEVILLSARRFESS